MSFNDGSIPDSLKQYLKAMFSELIDRLVSLNLITLVQANIGKKIINDKFG
jgi:hypothetical protein